MSSEEGHKRVVLAFDNGFDGPEVVKPVIDMLTHCPKVFELPVIYDIFCPASDPLAFHPFRHCDPIYRLSFLEPPQNICLTMSDVWEMNALEITKGVMGGDSLGLHDVLQYVIHDCDPVHKVDALIVVGLSSQLYWDAAGEEEMFLAQEIQDRNITTVFLDKDHVTMPPKSQTAYEVVAAHLKGISQPLVFDDHEGWQEICRVAGCAVSKRMLQKMLYGLHRPSGSLHTFAAKQFARRCLNCFAS